MPELKESSGLYVRRHISLDDTARYFEHIQARIYMALGNPCNFHRRNAHRAAVTLVNPPVVNFAKRSSTFQDEDPEWIRTRLLEALPDSRLSPIEVDTYNVEELSNGRTPVLAVRVGSTVLEEEHQRLLETLEDMGGKGVLDRYTGDLHVTIGRFVSGTERIATEIAEHNMPGSLLLNPVLPQQ